MRDSAVTFTVFTKPWKMDLPTLGKHVSGLGFEGIELPVRPGYPVNPENVTQELPRAARLLADYGLKIASIAGPTDAQTISACAEAGVPIIRICVSIRREETYQEGEARLQREFDALVPDLDRAGVTLGIQNHCGRDVCNAMGLRSLLGKYDPRHVAAVWDAAHNALQGEEPELALDIVWPHLCMVNLKNAFWKRTNGPEAEVAAWQPYWTTGRQGLASWPRVASELKRRNYNGVVCLTAEYNDEHAVDRLIAEDIAFARSLFA
ncbi:MAG TPA: sugar phosphate isomerase/epimerase family protein [Chthonomonadaceae bacterium]|nr:sugar phosphate isomerase/epimerase family protein [Chthonomonadaceae bacterium]